MPTPYDTTDGGKSFSREERIIAEFYGVDLNAPAPVKCDSCWQYCEAELVLRDNCPECVAMLREAANFIAAPMLAGCINLMAPVNEAGRLKWATLLAHESAIVAAIPVLEVGNDN